MNKWMYDSEVRHILADRLAEIARFAQSGFKRCGRGTVAIYPDDDAIARGISRYTLCYLSYKEFPNVPGDTMHQMIAGYDPLTELVVQYNRTCGKTRTMRLRAPSSPPDLRSLFRFSGFRDWVLSVFRVWLPER